VLVVDDDADNARLVADLLGDGGFEAMTATTGAAALQALATHRFELMITDIRMAGIDGIEVIRRALALDDTLAVIAMTAFGSLATGLRVLDAGALEYLAKPFQPAELHDRVVKALASRERRLGLQRMREENERLRRELDELLNRRKR
jgi:DNA-binding response OmpR family regulator